MRYVLNPGVYYAYALSFVILEKNCLNLATTTNLEVHRMVYVYSMITKDFVFLVDSMGWRIVKFITCDTVYKFTNLGYIPAFFKFIMWCVPSCSSTGILCMVCYTTREFVFQADPVRWSIQIHRVWYNFQVHKVRMDTSILQVHRAVYALTFIK